MSAVMAPAQTTTFRNYEDPDRSVYVKRNIRMAGRSPAKMRHPQSFPEWGTRGVQTSPPQLSCVTQRLAPRHVSKGAVNRAATPSGDAIMVTKDGSHSTPDANVTQLSKPQSHQPHGVPPPPLLQGLASTSFATGTSLTAPPPQSRTTIAAVHYACSLRSAPAQNAEQFVRAPAGVATAPSLPSDATASSPAGSAKVPDSQSQASNLGSGKTGGSLVVSRSGVHLATELRAPAQSYTGDYYVCSPPAATRRFGSPASPGPPGCTVSAPARSIPGVRTNNMHYAPPERARTNSGTRAGAYAQIPGAHRHGSCVSPLAQQPRSRVPRRAEIISRMATGGTGVQLPSPVPSPSREAYLSPDRLKSTSGPSASKRFVSSPVRSGRAVIDFPYPKAVTSEPRAEHANDAVRVQTTAEHDALKKPPFLRGLSASVAAAREFINHVEVPCMSSPLVLSRQVEDEKENKETIVGLESQNEKSAEDVTPSLPPPCLELQTAPERIPEVRHVAGGEPEADGGSAAVDALLLLADPKEMPQMMTHDLPHELNFETPRPELVRQASTESNPSEWVRMVSGDTIRMDSCSTLAGNDVADTNEATIIPAHSGDETSEDIRNLTTIPSGAHLCCSEATSGCDVGDPPQVRMQVDAQEEHHDAERAEPGDYVILGQCSGIPSEYRSSTGVVVESKDAHCKVAVLDSKLLNVIGECWPYYEDIVVEGRDFRLGANIVVEGLTSKNIVHMNGLAGVIRRHPREGHPSIITKASKTDGEQARITVCVQFKDSAAAGRKTALLEPRFLRAVAA